MPEEGIETQELKEKLEEAAEHGHHEKAGWIVQLSLSTALIAVIAAIASLLSGGYANDALVKKNESILNQTKAADQWGFFQAKSIKSAIYRTQSDVLAATGGENAKEAAKKLAEDSKREKEEQEAIKTSAEDFEKKAEDADKESEHFLHVHHEYAKSVTISQVAIALAAIAALTRKRAMWFVSMIAGLASIFFFLRGFGLF
ncbi:MAG TPA: DUF4337 family protein [Polyangiaceae bacterium]